MPPSLLGLRHDLHAHPELARGEHGTAARIVSALEPMSPDQLHTGLGGTGVVATFDGRSPGRELLLRAELDALPITETGADDHRSVHAGLSHACGHDGHAAILVGVAHELAEHRPQRGSVHLLFQPAEETGTGADAVLADPAFDHIRPDLGFALHNMPGFPLHRVVVKPGPMTPAVRSLVVTFGGRTAHASEPHLAVSPTMAVADLLHRVATLDQPDLDRPGFRLATTVHAQVGSPAYGVAPGDGEVHVTIRALDDETLAALQEEIAAAAVELAGRDGLTCDIRVVEDFAANINHHEATELVVRAAVDAGLEVTVPHHLGMSAGEDFGAFSSRFPCCMALLGAGDTHPPLHSPEYDFPDPLLDTGVRLLTQLIRAEVGTAS